MTAESLPPARARRADLELLRALTEAAGVSGAEGPVRAIVRRAIEAHTDRLWEDSLGNLLAVRSPGRRPRLRVLLAAHMDEVGLMVMDADGEGLLRFEPVGGVDPHRLPAAALRVGQAGVPGVIGAPPVHLSGEGGTREPFSVEALRIDIGARSRDEALARVRPGEWAVFATPFQRHGPALRAKALDDRLGVAMLIELLRAPPAGVELLAAFTVQEEVGLRGARVAAQALAPDAALALDTTPARDLPTADGAPLTDYNARLGTGPAVYVADRRTISHPGLLDHVLATAEAGGLRFQIRQPGGGGTDAGAIHLSLEGIPSLSISAPVRYLHGPSGLALLADWRATVRLVHAVLGGLQRRHLRPA